jgi:hypothetical protein
LNTVLFVDAVAVAQAGRGTGQVQNS